MEPSDYQPFDPQVHEYVDGRMSADAERDFARKLERNPELKKQVESLQKALELLHTLPVEEPKEGFDKRVIGRVKEEELAERARKQIVSAPVPMWQHVVQVGLGAAAAALVFAIIGVPGYFSSTDVPELPGSGGGEVARVTATEADLLPALADHRARFESMRRSVSCTRIDDPHEQRELMMLELQYSDLERRNIWLRENVADLPTETRAEYDRFINSLDEALTVIQNEISASLRETRAMDMGVIDSALGSVYSPRGAIENFHVSQNSGQLVPENELAATGSLDEVAVYSLLRRAEYRHDYLAVLDAADTYSNMLKDNRLETGHLKHHVNANAISACLRLGQAVEAAKRFKAAFGDYDEDVSAEQMKVVRGLLTDAEWKRLTAARESLRNE